MDGQLSDRKKATLSGHLEDCASCRSYEKSLKILQDEAGKLLQLNVQPEFMKALSKRLEESLYSKPAARVAKTIRHAGRWKWAWVGAAVLVFALVAGGIIFFFMSKTSPDPWPVSYEDSLAQILGEIGEDTGLAESFNQVLQASIGEALLQAESPTFWEGLDEEGVELMELDIANGREI